MLSKQENFGDQTWTKIVWKPHIFPFWTSGLIVFDKLWTPTNIWWNIVKLTYVWRVIKHVWYRLTTLYKRCLIIMMACSKGYTENLSGKKVDFSFARLNLTVCNDFVILVKLSDEKFAGFLFRPICRPLKLKRFCYTSKLTWRKSRFLFGPIIMPLQLYWFVILVNLSGEKTDL